MVEWFCKQRTDSLQSLGGPTPPPGTPPPLVAPEPSYINEPDRIAGLGLRQPTPEDELVTVLLGSMAGFIMKKCETRDCLKEVRVVKPPVKVIEADKSEEEEEEMMATETKRMTSVMSKKSLSIKPMAKRKSKIGKSDHTSAEKKKHDHHVIKEVDFEIIEEVPTSMTNDEMAFESEEEHVEVPEAEEQEGEAQIVEEINENEELKPRAKKVDIFELQSCTFKEQDQMADIVFKNNNRYKGRLSRMEMEEFGKFTWSNGQSYEGTIRRGHCHGEGVIEWNGGASIYDGQVSCNLRNGFGTKTYVNQGERMHHVGQWKDGKKHGQGKSVYGGGSWYEGDWENGLRHGVGTRFYKNGARYHGQWYKGMRHGRGTMIWPNSDVYIGEWNFGQMHGSGKYTWASSMDNSLVPAIRNSYTGQWCQNKRHGPGVLELMTGAIIKTTWYDGVKSGSCDIVCRNGNLISINDLFYNDKIDLVSLRKFKSSEDRSGKVKKCVHTLEQGCTKIRFHNDDPDADLKLSDASIFAKNDEAHANALWIPINAPQCEMDFSWHIDLLFKVENSSHLHPTNPHDRDYPNVSESERKVIGSLEVKWLRKVVMRRMGDLTRVYNFYALVFDDFKIPEHNFCMLRMCLWLLLRHCRLSETSLTLAQLDKMIGCGSDPFDKVMMHEMINYLLAVSWFSYVPKRKKNPDIDGIIASCFDKFIEEVVNTAPSRYDGNFMKHLRFLPFASLRQLYDSFKGSRRIEDICVRLFNPIDEDFEDRIPFIPPFYYYILQGKNIVGPDDLITYVPFEVPNFDYDKMKLHMEDLKPADLRMLGLVGIENVVRCIKEAIPEAIDPTTDELDGTFELSFIDFCEVLVNLVTVYLDMCEDYYRKIVDAVGAIPSEKPPQSAKSGDPVLKTS
ncbi:MORN [Nesidiocoris tenuis]|uniref:MORN n=1 Tax=Nesidiocoris tenuis TaxID=355587 RepID=A0ABN7AHJ7_9HEMI|nr:MORN [Nesidiocoris tenuis]